MTQDATVPKRSDQFLAAARMAVFVVSVVLCAAVSLCYYFRPDSCAAVTFWPTWLWLAPGLGLSMLAATRRRWPIVLAVALLWLVCVVVFADESAGLLRFHYRPVPGWQTAVERGEGLRVITINCSGGSLAAAEEVEPYHPDVVLLQETPEEPQVRRLARRLYGKDLGLARGVDTDIIARGRVTPVPLAGLPPFAYKQAHVRLASGIECEVFSVHFQPPVMRFDVWSPSCWREHSEKRLVHRQQMQEIAAAIAALPPTMPVIIGGDFNVPGSDGVFRMLRPRLHDTFKEGGVGWGDTVLNDMPVSRFDQIWVSRQFRAVAVVARKTVNSDHRMVICDLKVPRR